MNATAGVSTHQWVPVRTAIRVLGLSKQRVYQLIHEGKLTSKELDGTKLVSVRSIEDRAKLMKRKVVI
jgi:hypothetical protein